MPRPKRISVTLTAPDADGVAASQTPAGAGDLTLDGALASSGTVTLSLPTRIEITSASNISNRTLTITGTGPDDRALVEEITGPNATTVTTTGYFKTITQIAISGAAAGALTVGTADEVLVRIVNLDYVGVKRPAAISVIITGTINYTVEHTLDNIYSNDIGYSNGNWLPHLTLASKTTSGDGNYDAIPVACRLKINSYTSTPTVVFNVVQTGP